MHASTSRETDPLLSLKQIAAAFPAFTDHTLRKLISAGEIKAIRVGLGTVRGPLFIRVSEVEAFLARREAEAQVA